MTAGIAKVMQTEICLDARLFSMTPLVSVGCSQRRLGPSESVGPNRETPIEYSNGLCNGKGG